MTDFPLFFGEDQTPAATKRPRGNDRTLAQFDLIIAVHTHAVRAVAVQIDQGVIEGMTAELLSEELQGRKVLAHATRRQGLPRIGIGQLAAPPHQSWLENGLTEQCDASLFERDLSE